MESPQQPGRVVHPSRALRLLTDQLAGGGKRQVLDLGPAISENVAFFAALSCKLFIADLTRNLLPLRVSDEESSAAFERRLERDLPDTGGRTVDLVLAWDLLNYLRPHEIEALARQLGPVCRRGTLLFALISTHPQIPARPITFKIDGPESLVYDSAEQARLTCPRYKEPELARAMPTFHVEVSFLLRNGMQEYLLAYEPDRSS